MVNLDDVLPSILPEIILLRRELHRHPEIRMEERWTSARVSAFLSANDIPHTTGHARGTGIVATIGREGGPIIVLRADMDALEIDEDTGASYASLTPHRMHACGHDGHTAALCGAAKVLFLCRESLHCQVRCIFQPGEEMAAGGRYIVEEGLLDGVSAAFALHGWPSLPLGVVGTKPGWMMASASDFAITVQGVGCHGADPAAGVDPVLVAAHIITALQSIVSRELNPRDAGVVSVTSLRAGLTSNAIPKQAILRGTIRSFEDSVREVLVNGIERIASNVAAAFRADASTKISDNFYPALRNDPRMTSFARETVLEMLGPGALRDLDHAEMFAEDFAYYLQRVPGAYLYLGLNPDMNTPAPPLHSSHFDFPGAALEPAIRLLAGLAIRFQG